jgi:outer membrane lipoprotein-sorting protein
VVALRSFTLLALLVALVVATPVLAAPADPAKNDDSAWQSIETFRKNLSQRSPFTASFVQTYLPEGFSTGEKESGRMALHLPDCLRWDYGEPYPKSFILCGDVIHYWNGGDTEGHVEEIEAKREPGLDLLLVPVDELQRRYTASSKRTAQGVAVTLRPTEPSEFVVEATLEIDAKLDRLRVLRYVDPEGNRTEFVLSDFQSGVKTGTFNPPKDVKWLDEY